MGTTTIKEARKNSRIHIYISSLIFWSGIGWLLYTYRSGDENSTSLLPLILVLVGLILYLTTKLNIWWHSKPRDYSGSWWT